MKKYRLKKDLPFAKAGEIFQMGGGKRSGKNEKSLTSEKVITTVLWVNDITNFDEWFEEVKEFEEWKPKEGEQYKHAGLLAGARIDTWRDTDYDEQALSIGNCYPLDTPDDLIIKERVLIPQAMHRLKMAAKKAWFEFNGSEGPDWDDDKQRKYLLSYDHRHKEFSIYWLASLQESILPPFPTRRSAQAYIDNNLDDLKLLFGIE